MPAPAPAPAASPDASFATEFLRHYLKNGIGSMSKSDVDALVMHLLDRYSGENGRALGDCSNQVASERLRAPLSKIRKLRYDAGLKYGGRPEEEARRRFARLLAQAGLELDKAGGGTKIVFVVEDLLARNWIQGQIKAHGAVFDGSFNSELVRVEPDAFFALLRAVLDPKAVDGFRKRYDDLVKQSKREALAEAFRTLVSSFAKTALEAAGARAAGTLLQLPQGGA